VSLQASIKDQIKRIQWFIPIVLATQGAEARESVKPRSLRLAWALQQNPILLRKKKRPNSKYFAFCTSLNLLAVIQLYQYKAKALLCSNKTLLVKASFELWFAKISDQDVQVQQQNYPICTLKTYIYIYFTYTYAFKRSQWIREAMKSLGHLQIA
jgi:hypothetical protein